MSRAARTARGAFGALTATLLAATSHACAGGAVTPLAVLATALFALPLCVLLAGKMGSLWRLSLAVVTAQFIYHWSFSGLGLATPSLASSSSPGSLSEPVSPHAAHLGMLPSAFFAADTTPAFVADAWMWAAHALAAVLTIALVHRGERAAMHLIQVLRDAVPVRVPAAVSLPARPAILDFFTASPSRAQPNFLSAISYRGPPAAFTSAI